MSLTYKLELAFAALLILILIAVQVRDYRRKEKLEPKLEPEPEPRVDLVEIEGKLMPVIILDNSIEGVYLICGGHPVFYLHQWVKAEDLKIVALGLKPSQIPARFKRPFMCC